MRSSTVRMRCVHGRWCDALLSRHGRTGPAMTTPDDPARCPACGAASIPGARYCEACGHELADADPPGLPPRRSSRTNDIGEPATPDLKRRPATTAPVDADGATSPAAYGTSSPPPPGCASCHHTEINPDGYCDNCGTRHPAAANHSEVDLGGLAAVSDIGSRHHHNEDAMGLAALGPVDRGRRVRRGLVVGPAGHRGDRGGDRGDESLRRRSARARRRGRAGRHRGGRRRRQCRHRRPSGAPDDGGLLATTDDVRHPGGDPGRSRRGAARRDGGGTDRRRVRPPATTRTRIRRAPPSWLRSSRPPPSRSAGWATAGPTGCPTPAHRVVRPA